MIDYYPPKFPDEVVECEIKNDVPSVDEAVEDLANSVMDMAGEYAKYLSARRKREEENDALSDSNPEYSDSDE